MSALAIDTPAGRQAAEDVRAALKICVRPPDSFVITPPDKLSVCDAFLVRDGVATAIMEVKGRDFDEKKLRTEYRNEWLLSYGKLQDLQALSAKLCLPVIGCLYLRPEQKVLTLRLYDVKRDGFCGFNLATTKTRQPFMAGVIQERLNAFIDMAEAKVWT